MKPAISTKGRARGAHPASGPRYDLWMQPCGGILDEELDHRKFQMMRQAAKA